MGPPTWASSVRKCRVAIEQADTVDGQAAQRLDAGAVVEDEAGASRGLIVGIERAADVRGVTAATGAENQRLLAVVDETGADIQTLARGNDGSATAFLTRLLRVPALMARWSP